MSLEPGKDHGNFQKQLDEIKAALNVPADAANGITAGPVADQIAALAARVQALEDAAV